MAEAALKSSAAGLKPGVVTGKDYQALVAACKAGNYALPAVNVSSSHTINAVLEAAAKNKSDVIIQLSNGGAQFYAGQGFPDGALAKVLGAVSGARHVHMMAEHYGICVVLHTDHANKKLIPWVEGMLDHGYEGVRYIEMHVTNTLGWSATTGEVAPWVYQKISETFVLDEAMRRRLSDLNPKASARVAGRLLEACDRHLWEPDEATLAALREANDELEDRLEGVFVAEK